MLRKRWWEFLDSKSGNFRFRWDPSEFRGEVIGYEKSDEKSEKDEDDGFAVHRWPTEANGSPG